MPVSIIMPFFKKRDFIELSKNSVLSQTYQNFEIIIIYDDENQDDYEFIKNFEKKDRRIIAVASGFNTKNLRSSESLKLLNWGFRNTNTFEVSRTGKSLFELNTWLGKKEKIQVTSKEDYYITINKKDIRHLNIFLKYDGPIKAPVLKDEKIAELIVKNKDEIINTIPLYAQVDLKKVNFFKSLITSINYLIWGDV